MATRVYVMQLQFSKKCFLDNPSLSIGMVLDWHDKKTIKYRILPLVSAIPRKKSRRRTDEDRY
jgi:hypothetical protein